MNRMGSSKLWGKIIVLVAVCGWCLSAQAKYGGGSGTEAEPYRIGTVSDWQELMGTPADWESHFVLTADLDLEGIPLSPVGVSYSEPFTGVFDGNDCVIRNADLNMAGSDNVGLFGYVGFGGEIRNLGVQAVNIFGEHVGGLVGNNSGAITSCYATGSVTGSGDYSVDYVGGLAGENAGTITSCYATCCIWGGTRIGGLVGYNDSGTIISCYATGSVTGSCYYPTDYIGGLVGENTGTITSCYATGTVYGEGYVGGLVGSGGTITSCYATGTVSGTGTTVIAGGLAGEAVTITSCYATGAVSGMGSDVAVGGLAGGTRGSIAFSYATGAVSGIIHVGGLVGWSYGPFVSCFWDTQTSNQISSAGGIGLTTIQMKTMSIFQNAGWADKGWVMVDGVDTPRLAWENTDGVAIPSVQAIPLIGSGTEADPYQIHTAEDFASLSWYSSILDKHIRLMADLDLSGVTLYPISNTVEFYREDGAAPFTGIFDGNGHSLRNAVVHMRYKDCVGLFGFVGSGGQIKNLALVDVDILGRKPVGGLVGQNEGSVSFCYCTGSVCGSRYVGGLIGLNLGSISSCYTAGATNWTGSDGWYHGGLVGKNIGTITSCYATNTVSGRGEVGGLVGSNSATISSCYSTGVVSGSAYYGVGGLVGGKHGYPTIISSFWDTQTSEQTTSAGGEGKTTVEMKTRETYSSAGWDFEDIWMIWDFDYPKFQWELGFGHSPSGRAMGPVNTLRFTLGRLMDTTSFSVAEDITRFVGPLGAIVPEGYSWLNDWTLEVWFAPHWTPGRYEMVIGPDILGTNGKAMDTNRNGIPGEVPDDQYTATFEIVEPVEVNDGQPVSGTIAVEGQYIYYKVNVPEGQHLSIRFDDLNDAGHNELYIRYGGLPSRSLYDYRYGSNLGADQQLIVPETRSGTYYVLIYAESVPDVPSGFTLAAMMKDFTLESISPNRGGNSGRVSSYITGSLLSTDLIAQLVNDEGAAIEAILSTLVDCSKMFVTFDLSGLAPGRYDLVVEKPGGKTAKLDDAFEVIAARGPEVWLDLAMPVAVRAGGNGVFWIHYGNSGDADAPAPLIELILPADSSASMTPEGWQSENMMQIAGIVPGNPTGVLPPGSEVKVPIYFTAPSPSGHYIFTARLFDRTNTELGGMMIDWDAIEADMRPDGMTDQEWTEFWLQYVERAGRTYSDYMKKFIDYSVARSQDGGSALSTEQWLLGPVAAATSDLTFEYGTDYTPTGQAMLNQYKALEYKGGGISVVGNGYYDLVAHPLVPTTAKLQGLEWLEDKGGHRYSGWTFPPGGSIQGNFTGPVQYFPWNIQAPIVAGGAFLLFDYDYTGPLPTPDLTDLKWIQVITTIPAEAWTYVSIGGSYIDDDKDELPFYFSGNEEAKARDGVDYEFGDASSRPFTVIPYRNKKFTWNASLRLVVWNKARPGIVTTHQGFDWGFTIEEIRKPKSPEVKVPGSPNKTASGLTWVLSSWDPNKKVGPERLVMADGVVPYTIYFENDPNKATAPAQEVNISDVLDSDLDLSTLELTEIAFGDHVITVPPGRNYYETTVDLRADGVELAVVIEAGLHSTTRTAYWRFRSVDPEKMMPIENPLLGFLPVNDANHHGEGHVSFIIKPKPNTMPGTEIVNTAWIKFDVNQAMMTNEVVNIIGPGDPDMNNDGLVNLSDLVMFADRWLHIDCTAANSWCENADLDFDGRIDLLDYVILAEKWLSP